MDVMISVWKVIRDIDKGQTAACLTVANNCLTSEHPFLLIRELMCIFYAFIVPWITANKVKSLAINSLVAAS